MAKFLWESIGKHSKTQVSSSSHYPVSNRHSWEPVGHLEREQIGSQHTFTLPPLLRIHSSAFMPPLKQTTGSSLPTHHSACMPSGSHSSSSINFLSPSHAIIPALNSSSHSLGNQQSCWPKKHIGQLSRWASFRSSLSSSLYLIF